MCVWQGSSRKKTHITSPVPFATSNCCCTILHYYNNDSQSALPSVRRLALARAETQTQSDYNHHHLFSQLPFCVNIYYSVRFRSHRKSRILSTRFDLLVSTRVREKKRCIDKIKKKKIKFGQMKLFNEQQTICSRTVIFFVVENEKHLSSKNYYLISFCCVKPILL